MAYRKEHPEYVPGSGRPDLYPPPPPPPPPQATRPSGSRSGTYRDAGERGLPPRPRTPDVWGDGYRADSRGGHRGDVDRESQGRYESYGTSAHRNESYGTSAHRNESYGTTAHRNEGYATPGQEHWGYRNVETARNSRGSFYNHANTSDNGGVALYSRFDGNTSRGDQYGSQYYNQPPLGAYEPSSYSTTYGAYQPYERSQASGWRPHGHHPMNDNYRSDHRGFPTAYPSSRGPLSSSRFSQSINKHSRYAAPSTAFSTSAAAPPFAAATATDNNRRALKAARKAARKAAKPEATPPPTDRTFSPPPPLLPFPKTALPVPKPSQHYLSLSLIPSPRLTSLARQLIILDLNGTILARERGRAHSGSLSPTPRPGLGLFLRYLFANFNVMVWSSAQPDNVRMMVRALFSPSQKAELLALWGRDTLGLTKQQFSAKTQVYKRLERVWEGQYKIPHSEEGCTWDQTNTMLLDDSKLKAKGQPWNHIEMPEFSGTKDEQEQDRALYALVGYLEEVKWSGNVSAFIREVWFKVGGKWDAVGTMVLNEYKTVE